MKQYHTISDKHTRTHLLHTLEWKPAVDGMSEENSGQIG